MPYYFAAISPLDCLFDMAAAMPDIQRDSAEIRVVLPRAICRDAGAAARMPARGVTPCHARIQRSLARRCRRPTPTCARFAIQRFAFMSAQKMMAQDSVALIRASPAVSALLLMIFARRRRRYTFCADSAATRQRRGARCFSAPLFHDKALPQAIFAPRRGVSYRVICRAQRRLSAVRMR